MPVGLDSATGTAPGAETNSCPMCGNANPHEAASCPQCGEDFAGMTPLTEREAAWYRGITLFLAGLWSALSPTCGVAAYLFYELATRVNYRLPELSPRILLTLLAFTAGLACLGFAVTAYWGFRLEGRRCGRGGWIWALFMLAQVLCGTPVIAHSNITVLIVPHLIGIVILQLGGIAVCWALIRRIRQLHARLAGSNSPLTTGAGP